MLRDLQGLQVQAHRRDGRLQLVRDGVDEGVLLLVAPDFPHQEDGVQNHAGDDQAEQQDAETSNRPVRQLMMIQPTFSATASATMIAPSAINTAIDLRLPAVTMFLECHAAGVEEDGYFNFGGIS